MPVTSVHPRPRFLKDGHLLVLSIPPRSVHAARGHSFCLIYLVGHSRRTLHASRPYESFVLLHETNRFPLLQRHVALLSPDRAAILGEYPNEA